MDVAAAAVKQADARDGADEEQEIPAVTLRPERSTPRSGRDRGPAPKGHAERAERPKRGKRGAITPDWNVTRIYVGAGRKSKIRPADLVGAIVNEAGIDPRAIGAIQITDRFSLVEVPDEVADEIIGTLRAATIKGRRVPVRRDRELNQGTE